MAHGRGVRATRRLLPTPTGSATQTARRRRQTPKVWEPPLTRQQWWMYRHGRAVRVFCLVFVIAELCSAGYNLAGGHLFVGVLSLLICGSPVSMFLTTRALERKVDRRGLDDSGYPTRFHG